MAKRRRSSTSQNDLPITKKHCLPRNKRDHISHLSSELLIRILHHLPIETLLSCHSVSQHFYTLTHDSQLWKSLYYSRFVLPRALRIPGIKSREKSNKERSTGELGGEGSRNKSENEERFRFSSRRSRWLDEEGLRNRGDGRETNWKRQYKLRHNWARGACEVKELEISERGNVPTILVRLAGGVVITVGEMEGLKAWGLKERKLVTTCGLDEGIPTCLAVDEQDGEKGRLGIVVGFEDGGWGTWVLDVENKIFVKNYRHPPSSNGMLSAIAYAHPYILSITERQLLSFYTLSPVGPMQESEDKDKITNIQENVETPIRPHLLTSLKSHSSWPPLSLSIRLTSSTIIASVVYTLPTYLSGHTISIQELHFTLSSLELPTLTNSRLTSSFPSGFQPLTSSAPRASLPRPTSLSYAHPYILATHPDNTLSLYLCTSTHTSLALSSPQKLFGHTSSISFASITSRGKAVSVSERGGELRVWELEPGLFKKGEGLRVERSVRVGEGRERQNGNGGREREGRTSNDTEKRKMREDLEKKIWVGFDEEMVIVLKSSEEDSGCECEGDEEEVSHGQLLINAHDENGLAVGEANSNEVGNGCTQQRLVIYDFT
ncbi:uncharacterized protein EAE98_004798 [Botrytis deweyae]|uniref:F-box domain-containing protein n=1 Tax=Botrytis deweyae TaxID=2478750 RepID=A0ABQ7IPC3_9HELO|nr:uncharacterized protein EAE98_004798 [Botrytis deweyae]KAF7930398.1 hypothetical protein EAE98_004798 [Botrytis deweyae]